MSIASLWAQTNLKALYHLENTSDSSGNSYTLTNNNTVSFATQGAIQYCADFGTANTNKSLSVANNLGITSGSVTISIRVKLRTELTSNKIYRIVEKSSATGYIRYQIDYEYTSGTRRLRFDRCKGGVGHQIAYYNIALGTSSWYDIALVYDGSNVMGYVNGNKVVSAAASGTGDSDADNGLRLGSNVYDASPASVYLDEVAIFSSVNTDNTLRRRYALSSGKLY